MTILDDILARKRGEVEAAQRCTSAAEMAERALAVSEAPRGFRAALAAARPPAVIAEIKRKSPSKGEIRPGLDPVACAKEYAEGGAAALSILTDEHFFGGHLDYLRLIRSEVPLPLLRKDFTVDRYQIDEARVAGADAVLLIVAALSPETLAALHAHARSLGLDALVEVHDEAELEVALEAGSDWIGVNNRDLATFEVDLATTERLAARLPRDVLLVAESGIASFEDVTRLSQAGARAFLVGESLMRQPNIRLALAELRGLGGTEGRST